MGYLTNLGQMSSSVHAASGQHVVILEYRPRANFTKDKLKLLILKIIKIELFHKLNTL
jgi:hypothetical protein